MTDPGAPRPRGRHSSPETDGGRVPPPWTDGPVPPRSAGHGPTGRRASDSRASGSRASDTHGADARRWDADDWSAGSRNWDEDTAAWQPVRPARRADALAGAATGGMRRVPGVVDHRPGDRDEARELSWRHSSGGSEGDEAAREPAPGAPSAWPTSTDDDRPQHPSAPLPPRPPGTWERLARRADPADDEATAAVPPVVGGLPPVRSADEHADEHAGDHSADHSGDHADGAPFEPHPWEDETGGLEVIGAHVDEHLDDDLHERVLDDDLHDEDPHDDGDLHDDDVVDGDRPGGRGGRGSSSGKRGGRRRRRPLAILIALVVFAGLVLGIVFGGQKLIDLVHPSSKDYTGQGTGSVQIRVEQGDTLSDIARTLQKADVIAGVGPFVDAAEADPASMGITSGLYQLRSQMSGQAALDLMLDPASRLFAKVTVREGLTAAATLQVIADGTGTPIDQLQAAAADTATLGLPAYANGSLEGFLFPATYEWEPGTTPAQMLQQMVARTVQALDELGIPEDQRLTVLTEASLVQAEASSTEDMAKVAQVLDNRLAIGMRLQLDTTVNYANGKSGLTTTPDDRNNPSPYNTYVHDGLPPGPIGNPGEDALRAVLSPTPGDWLYFVVVDPDTGDTRFAVTAEEHQANVVLFQQWLQAHPGG